MSGRRPSGRTPSYRSCSMSGWSPAGSVGRGPREDARRMTHGRAGRRRAEADVARNVADLLNRAHGQDLNPAEAKAVAVDASRPLRPPREAPDDPATTPKPDEDGYEQVE